MQRRELGKTGIELCPISFGGITVSRLSEDETRELVDAAISAGVNYFDTAHSYADTSKKLGMVLPQRRTEIVLGAKVLDRHHPEAYQRLLDSLTDLNAESTDIMWLHAIDTLKTLHEVLSERGAVQSILRCRKEGLTRFVGITGHRPDILARALELFPFDAVMTPVNYLYRFSFAAEAGLIPLCLRKGVGVVAIKPRGYQTLSNMSTAYRYVLAQGATTMIPHGTPDEMRAALDILPEIEEMPREEESELLSTSPELSHICRQCGYCLPCPKGINVPFILRLSDIWHGPHRVRDFSATYAAQVWSRGAYGELLVKGDACDRCGACEDRCPFGIDITDQLMSAHQKLTRRR